jgi:fucose permease
MDLVEEEKAARANKIRFFIIVPLVAGFLLLYGGAENTYSVWVAKFAEEVYELGKDDAAFVDAMFFATLTIGRFISGKIVIVFSNSDISSSCDPFKLKDTFAWCNACVHCCTYYWNNV